MSTFIAARTCESFKFLLAHAEPDAAIMPFASSSKNKASQANSVHLENILPLDKIDDVDFDVDTDFDDSDKD